MFFAAAVFAADGRGRATIAHALRQWWPCSSFVAAVGAAIAIVISVVITIVTLVGGGNCRTLFRPLSLQPSGDLKIVFLAAAVEGSEQRCRR